MRRIYAVCEACQRWDPVNRGGSIEPPYLCEGCQRPAVLWNDTALLARFWPRTRSDSDHQDIA
jgi:hypothetical protein